MGGSAWAALVRPGLGPGGRAGEIPYSGLLVCTLNHATMHKYCFLFGWTFGVLDVVEVVVVMVVLALVVEVEVVV